MISNYVPSSLMVPAKTLVSQLKTQAVSRPNQSKMETLSVVNRGLIRLGCGTFYTRNRASGSVEVIHQFMILSTSLRMYLKKEKEKMQI